MHFTLKETLRTKYSSLSTPYICTTLCWSKSQLRKLKFVFVIGQNVIQFKGYEYFSKGSVFLKLHICIWSTE